MSEMKRDFGFFFAVVSLDSKSNHQTVSVSSPLCLPRDRESASSDRSDDPGGTLKRQKSESRVLCRARMLRPLQLAASDQLFERSYVVVIESSTSRTMSFSNKRRKLEAQVFSVDLFSAIDPFVRTTLISETYTQLNPLEAGIVHEEARVDF